MTKTQTIMKALQELAKKSEDGVIHTNEGALHAIIGDEAKEWDIHLTLNQMKHQFASYTPDSLSNFRIELKG